MTTHTFFNPSDRRTHTHFDNVSAPQFFDLQHFGVKTFHQLGWYMMNSSHMIKYLKQKEVF